MCVYVPLLHLHPCPPLACPSPPPHPTHPHPLSEMRSLLRRYPDFADMRAALTGALWSIGKEGEAESQWWVRRVRWGGLGGLWIPAQAEPNPAKLVRWVGLGWAPASFLACAQ